MVTNNSHLHLQDVYDFKIKGAKVFAACNEITRLSRPLQSRFRRLHLPLSIDLGHLKIDYSKYPIITSS